MRIFLSALLAAVVTESAVILRAGRWRSVLSSRPRSPLLQYASALGQPRPLHPLVHLPRKPPPLLIKHLPIKDHPIVHGGRGPASEISRINLEWFNYSPQNIVPVAPGDLPDDLKAQIVNPFDFNEIPTLDFSLSDDELLEPLRVAAHEIGFFSIVKHNVEPELMDRVFDRSRKFFSLPLKTKRVYEIDSASGPMAGYFGKGVENLDDVLNLDDEAGAATRKVHD